MTQHSQWSEQELSLHFLVVLDSETWVAHCLDFDIAAQGGSEDEAVQNLIHAIELLVEQAIEDGEPGCLFQSAPQGLWDIYVKSPPQSKRSKRFHLDVEEPHGVPKKMRFEERVQVPA